MPGYEDFQPPVVATAEQKRDAENRGNLLEAIVTAFKDEWSPTRYLLDPQARHEMFLNEDGTIAPGDPDYRVKPEDIVRWGEGLPPDYLEQFQTVGSEAQGQAMRRYLFKRLASEQQLAKWGWTGGGLRMLAGMTDPVSVLATVVTEGLAGEAIYGAKLTRIARAFRSGMVAAGTNVGIEAIQQATDPVRDDSGYIYALAGGALLGTGFGLLKGARPHLTQAQAEEALKSLRKTIEASDIAQVGAPFTVKGKMYYATQELLRKEAPAWLTGDEELLRKWLAQEITDTEAARIALRKMKTAKPEVVPVDAEGKPLEGKALDDWKAAQAVTPAPVTPKIDLSEGSPLYPPLFLHDTKRGGPELVQKFLAGEITDEDFAKQAGRLLNDHLDGMGLAGERRTRAIDESKAAFAEWFPKIKQAKQAALDAAAHAVDETELATMAARLNTLRSYIEFDPSYRAPLDLTGASAAEPTGVAKLRFFGMRAKLLNSKLPMVRKIARMAWGDPLAPADNLAVSSVNEFRMHQNEVRMAQFYRQAIPAAEAWMEKQGITGLGRTKARDQFMELVGRAIRGEDVADPFVQKVAQEVAEQHRLYLKMLREAKVKGFAELAENIYYLMRVHRLDKIHKLIAQHGSDKPIIEMLTGSLMKAASETGRPLTKEMAEHLSTAYLRNIMKREFVPDLMKGRLFAADQLDSLKQALKENLQGVEGVPHVNGQIEEGYIDSLVKALDVDPSQKGVISRAKHRMDFDETFSHTFTAPDGTTQTIRFSDLLENNAELLMNAYSHQALSAVAARKFLDALGEGMGKQVDSFETFLAELGNEAMSKGMSANAWKRQAETLALLWRHVQGVPLHSSDGSAAAEVLRIIGDMNYLRVGGQFGFAQIAEIGNITSMDGIRTFFQAIPAFRQLRKMMNNKKFMGEIHDDVASCFAPGSERLRNQIIDRFESHSNFDSVPLAGFQRFLAGMKRALSDVSGLSYVDSFSKQLATTAALQKFSRMAMEGREFTPKMLQWLGLTAEDMAGIAAQIKAHATFVDGWAGRSLANPNFNSWTNQALANKLIYGTSRMVKRAIQVNDIGALSGWMTTAWGKAIIQFRTFMLNAYEKQLLHGMHHRNFNVFAAFATTTFFGGVSYMVQTGLNGLGRGDWDEYVENRLSIAEIGKAAFQRAGYSTFLPAIVDTVVEPLAGEPVFAYGRTSGLDTGLVKGIPTADFVVKFGQTLHDLTAAAAQEKKEFRKSHWRNTTGLLWFNNVVGVRNILNATGDELFQGR